MENKKTNKRHRHSIRRIITALFCMLIGICVAVVMFFMYNPSQNALRALSSVCMDVVCIIILFIIIGSFMFGKYDSKRTTRLYGVLLIATIWAIFLDFLNWAFDGNLQFGHLTFWFTVGSLCMGAIIACVFSLYLDSYMEETHELSDMYIRTKICAVLNIVSFVITFVLAISGTAFMYVDGHYETGVLYDVVTVIPILTVLYLTGFVIRNIKKVGSHDVFAATGYIVFMVAGALIEAAYSIGTTYVAVAIADIFIFVTLQNEIIATEKKKVQKWMKRSKTDELTGLYNRYAYEADLAAEENQSDDFVYVSVDVNSLKNVNDTLGHSAGDELLIGASECLEKCLSQYGKLYRLGGDEFVGLIHANEKDIETIKSNIDELTNAWRGELVDKLSISYGIVMRKEAADMTIKQIAVLADKRMYEAKREYYRAAGVDRRKG